MKRQTTILMSLLLMVSSFAHALTLDQKPKQGALIIGHTSPGAHVVYDDKELAVTPDGTFVFGLGRDAKGHHQLTATLPDGTTEQKSFKVISRQFKIQHIDGIAKKIMHPSAAHQQRARKDAEQVWVARSKASTRTDFMDGFQWPLTGPITGVYGSQRVFNGEPKRPHYGVDIAAPKGTKVVAPAAGKVTLWVPDMFYSGGTMIIDHGYGVSSTFIHLSGSLVKVGDQVKAGQPVALVGSSGRATGPHLDWRINWFEVRLDPQLIAPPMPKAKEGNH